jgi:hypothetical protein
VLGGIPGPLLGGYLTDWLVQRDARWRAWLPAIATLGCLPIYLAALLSTNFWIFLGLFSCGYLVFLTAQAPTVSLIQLAVRPDERAMAMAVAMIFNNLIGQALGLFLIGLASTSLTPTFGPQALTWALIGVSAAFAVPAALFYLLAARQHGARSPQNDQWPRPFAGVDCPKWTGNKSMGERNNGGNQDRSRPHRRRDLQRRDQGGHRSAAGRCLEDSPYPGGVTKVATHRYWSKEEHEREVERLWKRVWQMACHEDDIPNVGDTYVYRNRRPLVHHRAQCAG